MDGIALSIILLGAILLISTALILIGLRFHQNRIISKIWMVVALTPSVLSLGLFWSLAIHLRHSLGGWPLGIGFAELQGPLLFHAQVAFNFFWLVTQYSIMNWPLYCGISAIFPPFRKTLLYAGIYSAGLALVTIFMFAAPSGFQQWWWD